MVLMRDHEPRLAVSTPVTANRRLAPPAPKGWAALPELHEAMRDSDPEAG
jgi:hypothetical protein